MGLQRIFVLLYVIGCLWHTPVLYRTGGLVLWPSLSPDLSPFDFLPKGQFQGTGVSGRSDCANGLVRGHAACTSEDTTLLRHAHSSILIKPASLCTAETLSICHFKYLQILLLMCPIWCVFLALL
ncbi:hypothetical protein TNCV_1567131 [Trichonephila clavipes]|nr:hypothetical protein TNCV_1567131 [Trichonephila clavipes]